MFCSKFLTIWLQGGAPLIRIGTMLTFQNHKIPKHIWVIFMYQNRLISLKYTALLLTLMLRVRKEME